MSTRGALNTALKQPAFGGRLALRSMAVSRTPSSQTAYR